MSLSRCITAAVLLAVVAAPARAHGPLDAAAPWWTWWSWEPVTTTALVLSALWYTAGVARLWRAAGAGAGITAGEAACYAGGWLTLVVALLSPLHPIGQRLFAVHMGQHELLMLVAAPLLVLGRPLIAAVWAAPRRLRPLLVRPARWRWARRLWVLVTLPLVAWAIHAAALWTWHVPALFESTLYSEWVHAAQHLCFLLSALLFWWALLHRRGAMGYGVAVLYLFTTSLHSGLLGALLTFAATVWYPAYAVTAPDWGLTGLQDQQLGGLVMWIPAGMVYLIAGLALVGGWLREAARAGRAATLSGSGVGAPALPPAVRG